MSVNHNSAECARQVKTYSEAYLAAANGEVERLKAKGVLGTVPGWSNPTFMVPIKGENVRFVSDPNDFVKDIPRAPNRKVKDVSSVLRHYRFGTWLKLDRSENAGHMAQLLEEETYHYAKETFQDTSLSSEDKKDIMPYWEYARHYTDDVLCVTCGNYDDHLAKLKLVLERLDSVGQKVSAVRSMSIIRRKN